MTNTRIVLMIAVLCGLPAVSQAQPVDVGVTIGAGTTNALGSDFGSSFGTRGLVTGAHVTLPINERFAIQPLVTYGRSTEAPYPGPGLTGGERDHRDLLVGVVVEQRFHTARPTLQAFMTYGLAAGWERDEVAPMTYFNGRTNQTIPGYTSHDFAEIPISLFGGGIRQAVGRHLAIRAEAQVSGFFIIPIGIRGSIGLAVALGK
jgi:hypothetical protein